MPKIVDHDARREEIAQALWRVVRRDGIRAASVRTVAAEAGWSAGAVRYYFPDQDGLLSFAMQLVSRRVGQRITALTERGGAKGSATAVALRYLEEALPLDEERMAEFDIWLSFMAQAQAESGVGTLHDTVEDVHNGLRELCAELMHALYYAGSVREGLELNREVERLHALIDGLALHAAIQPAHTTPARARQLLRYHIDSLLTESALQTRDFAAIDRQVHQKPD
ncbi:TetR family transcriptional regulator [Kribbella sandramycini]|uniref:DNA-binding transcriptional regulator YbjK n=1 Tax=Kribbella sandramycini TaxID=60450 RepID=A0A7Y4KYZ9_9ACTN|nr:TetR family transcriptional regulator C-terminal domain-containing protein [Kribbella sandramycini]MBB6565006.1 DNA-binding transcriptional regulator YbjK [Kribbella sandramycini]NOL41278.1 TetR family transcriptional regulator [Kribbella sandramycini]